MAVGPSIKDITRPVNFDLQLTVAVSGTTSDVVDLGGQQLVGIFVPATVDGTAITLQASPDGTTFSTVQADHATATAYTIVIVTATASYVPLANLAIVAGIRWLRLVCGSSQTTTATVFTLATRPV